jgi:hypothetical protein
MTRLDRYLLSVAALLSLIFSAGVISDAIYRSRPSPPEPAPYRYSIQQTFSDGWLLFDSREGRFCTIVRDGSRPSVCTSKPQL